MKLGQMLLILFVAAYSSDEAKAGDLKNQKTFEEIFGKGWDNEKENSDQQEQIDPNHSDQQRTNEQFWKEKFRHQFDCIFEDDENCNEAEDEADELDLMALNGDQKNNAKIVTDQQKRREIVSKFHEQRENYKKKGKFLIKEWNRIEAKIANGFGVSRDRIYTWKREFGLINANYHQKPKYSYAKKRQFIAKYFALKKEFTQMGRHNQAEWKQFQKETKQNIGVSLETIIKWRKEFGLLIHSKKKEDSEKIEIVKKLDEIRKNFRQMGRHSDKEWQQFEQKIAKDLGANRTLIFKWKKEFGLISENSRQQYSEAKKHELLTKFDQIKGANNAKSDDKIAKDLGVNRTTIFAWKKKFGLIKNYRQQYSEAKKRKLLKQFDRSKSEKNAKTNVKIAKDLDVNIRNIYKWKKQLGEM